MPSHSSSSGSISGGGHVGGSFGGGGFHSEDSFGPPPPRRPRGPIYMPFFGRTVIISSGARSAFATGFFFLIAAIIILVASVGIFGSNHSKLEDYNERLKTLERQDTGYSRLIENANAARDGYGITTATFANKTYQYWDYEEDDKITGIFKYHTTDSYSTVTRYFIRYSFVVDGYTIYGETFAKYLLSDIERMPGTSSKTMQIAYHKLSDDDEMIDNEGPDSNASNYYYDSINADFKALSSGIGDIAFELGEANFYIDSISGSVNTSKIVLIAVSVVVAIIVVLLILAFARQIKRSQKEQAVKLAMEQEELQQKQEANKLTYCKYCGSKLPEGEERCPNCGSSQFVKK